MAQQFELLGLSLQELTAIVQKMGQPPYRARQLFDALYRQRVAALGDITTLPQSFRRRLEEESYIVGAPRMERSFVSQDGTIRYLFAFADGQSVETVWMPEGDGGEAGDGSDAGDSELVQIGTRQSDVERGIAAPARPRADGSTRAGSTRARASKPRRAAPSSWQRATICVSSQAGCAVDCQFCMTALLGLQRNLTAGEIAGQVLAVLNDRTVDLERDRINLVFMGQGEPFLNYDNWIKAVRLLTESGITERHMTVSTAGIVPRIADLGRETVRPKLAISLNASNDEVRSRIMPLNRKWNLEKLLAAAREFPLRARERLTFEYVLLAGENDQPQHASELLHLMHGLRAKINLIALNPGPDIPFATPSDEQVQNFQRILMAGGVPAFIRRPRGRDIFAACGQLKRMAG